MPETKLYVRVKQALNWLKRNRGILQKDIADKIGMAESSFTRALSRCKETDDKDFVILFHSAVNEYISLDYLLYGEGELTLQIDHKFDNMEQSLKDDHNTIDGFGSPKQTIDQSSLINAALAAKDETIKSKDETIASLRETIESLKRENDALRQQMSVLQSEDVFMKHPFPVGVAENDDRKSSRV